MDKLYIVMPAYNEEANIEKVVTEWYPIVEKIGSECRFVVVNDGSTDSTYEKLLELKKTKPQLEPLTKENSGHGPSILYGYKYALENGANYVFQTDSDGQTRPEEFVEFWLTKDKYDMIIGHRRGRQDGLSRIFVTKILKLVCLLRFHVMLTDANTPFRLIRADKLKKAIALIPDDFNLSNVLMSVIFAKKKYRVKYIEITFKPRQGGVNSINMKKIFKIGKKAWRDFAIMQKCIKES